ncbi:MAG TPA: FAD-binding oxidoreductase [Actinomycetota bacterium]|nr:FAD-binding oxidoreductase [Actinomycetota bacterium]
MRERTTYAIVGAGITGLALAWELTRRGVGEIVVIDRSYSGAGGSGRNVGRIRAMQLTRELATFALAAQRKHDRLGGELGANTLFWRAGYAWVLYDDEEIERMRAALDLLRELRIPARLHDTRGALRRLAVLRGGEVPTGAMIGRDAIVHHDAVMYAYRKALARTTVRLWERREVAGLLREGSSIRGVAFDDGELRADVVVNAAGGWARDLSRMAGLDVPNTPVRREVLVTEPSQPFIGPAITFYRPMEGWFNQTLRGEMVAGVVDATEPSGLNHASTFEFLRRTASVLLRKAPRLGHLRVIRQWGGVYDMTPDRKPLVGPSRHAPGLVQANGYSGRGFALAPIVAELLAGWLETGERPDTLAAFDPDRFAGVAHAPLSADYYAGYGEPKR